MRAEATGTGNALVLFGATTGRDGIGGASVLASQELAGLDAKAPVRPDRRPVPRQALIEVSLELVERRPRARRSRTAAPPGSPRRSRRWRATLGIDVHLDRVPLREPDLEPWEIMISESQERMVAVVRPTMLDAVQAVCARWELPCTVIGEVTERGELRAFYDGDERRRDPGRAPHRRGAALRGAARAEAGAPGRASAAGASHGQALLELLARRTSARARGCSSSYDHLVGSRTRPAPRPRRGGAAAAALAARHRRLARRARRSAARPVRTGGALAVIEAARNVACAGGEPLALTDCLNFGNPEKPEIAWELAEAIEGIARAAEALGIPVVSGNVSLYNETDGRPIPPTPVVGCVGLVEDVRARPVAAGARATSSCSPVQAP